MLLDTVKTAGVSISQGTTSYEPQNQDTEQCFQLMCYSWNLL